jgi:hypothetical protein
MTKKNWTLLPEKSNILENPCGLTAVAVQKRYVYTFGGYDARKSMQTI